MAMARMWMDCRVGVIQLFWFRVVLSGVLPIHTESSVSRVDFSQAPNVGIRSAVHAIAPNLLEWGPSSRASICVGAEPPAGHQFDVSPPAGIAVAQETQSEKPTWRPQT